jgi:hypothetical protein
MPRVHCPTGLDFAFLSKTTRPDSSTTHTEVSFWETSNPTYCFMTASESFGCNKSKVTGLLSPLTVDRNYVIVPKSAVERGVMLHSRRARTVFGYFVAGWMFGNH